MDKHFTKIGLKLWKVYIDSVLHHCTYTIIRHNNTFYTIVYMDTCVYLFITTYLQITYLLLIYNIETYSHGKFLFSTIVQNIAAKILCSIIIEMSNALFKSIRYISTIKELSVEYNSAPYYKPMSSYDLTRWPVLR